MGYGSGRTVARRRNGARRGRLARLGVAALLVLGSAAVVPARQAAAPAARYDLEAAERLGGHTLARHVGKSDAQLRDRLRREPGISAASTFTDRDTAERVVAAAIARSNRRIGGWLARTGPRPNLALDYRGDAADVIGRTLRRGETAPTPCIDAVVVLRWDRGGGYYVLTSYPERRR